MSIVYLANSKEFHLYNDDISYIIQILDNGQLGNLYYGKRIGAKEDFSYLLQGGNCHRPLAVFNQEDYFFMCQEYTKMEYPSTGTGDYREPAFEIIQENGSRIVDLKYKKHTIYQGKNKLPKLPSTYVESEEEAETLEIVLCDELLSLQCALKYSIFRDFPVIARSVEFINKGNEKLILNKVLSMNIDLPDSDFEMINLAGAWARERHVVVRPIQTGLQGIGSRKGASSAEHNPFIALKRPHTNENMGEVYGFSLIYSGNHLEMVEVDSCGMTRVQAGIHPDGFAWQLLQGESFHSPEVVMVYSPNGLNGMSQVFHKLYRTRLARGVWRDKVRPILINNWEATGPDFTESKIVEIAKNARELGAELFVLDDGWFGNRENDVTGLGDWYVKNFNKLPEGICGLARKINELDMQFGLWIEPEMVNKDSDLYREHPDWILCAPNRSASPSRNQYVLDFSRQEVVDYIFGLLEKVMAESNVSYIKWDMNRYISECYSNEKTEEEQGKVFHQYILGVYQLYERLIERFPKVLFESCSSGGARFDPGMLYYAPQTWCSDDTDAIERIQIQYGTSYVYPLISMGAHVSEVPNQQVGRVTPIETRANVAMFGAFGYELDPCRLTERERKIVKKQIAFVKKHRELVQNGDFYRLLNPFENRNAAWMVVSTDKKQALVGFYCIRAVPNDGWTRIRLAGLEEERNYIIEDNEDVSYSGSELMNVGMIIRKEELCAGGWDFGSKVYYLQMLEN